MLSFSDFFRYRLVRVNAQGQLIDPSGGVIPTGSGGAQAVASVNGKTGAVALTATDIPHVYDEPPVTDLVYTAGKLTSYVENGVTHTVTYNPDGSLHSDSDGTTTKTVTYNVDGTIGSYT